MILRPYGIIIDGTLELGVELVIEDGVIQEVRPHTGIPELFVVSPAFVNAHSHLEYRSLQDKIHEYEYWGWIREITRLKKLQSADEIRSACLLAAAENSLTGVAVVLEHNDRAFAGIAMKKLGLRGAIFQEVITILESQTANEKLNRVRENAATNAENFDGPVFLNPHAYQTVDRETLKTIGELKTPLSIHAAETSYENQLTMNGVGPIADFYRANGVPVEPTGKSVIASLDELVLVRENTQLVHCCALEEGDIELIRSRGANVAHCPRSNARLNCPPAPIRELLDADIAIGIGLDSAASSGAIDMFDEMRAALSCSLDRGRPISGEEIWRMATTTGREIAIKMGVAIENWNIEPGASPPLLKIHIDRASITEDIIERATPNLVDRVEYEVSEQKSV